jgi:hypothetical protein
MSHLKFIPASSGLMRVWMHPVSGRAYVIGADVAEYKQREGSGKGRRIIDAARAHGDMSAAVVMELESAMVVATIMGNLDTHEYGRVLLALGTYYNTATIAVEVTGPGRGTQDYLTNSAEYPNCWVDLSTEKLSPTSANAYGWQTNVVTRPIMVRNAQEMIADKDAVFRIADAELVRQMQTMEYDKQGKPRGVGSNHDDLAMAYMIALEVRRKLLQQSTPINEEEERYNRFAVNDRELRRREDLMAQRERESAFAGDEDAASWE